MAVIYTKPTFAEAAAEARRLAAEYKCSVAIEQSSAGWDVIGPVADDTPWLSLMWREDVSRKEQERVFAEQLSEASFSDSEYEYEPNEAGLAYQKIEEAFSRGEIDEAARDGYYQYWADRRSDPDPGWNEDG